MTKAVKDFGPASTPPRLTRQRGGPGTYSPSGIWGDPTLATPGKGRVIVESLVSAILDDIAQLRAATLPTRSTAAPGPAPASPQPAPPAGGRAEARPDTCTPGDERTIRNIGNAFATHWANKDAALLGGLWTALGNIIHPDGVIEQGSQAIAQSRARLFAMREYQFSRHPLYLGLIRCLSADIAVADGTWQLRGVVDSTGKPLPTMEGQTTLVVKRDSNWAIEAYRYTITPAPGQKTPGTQKRPGLPDAIIK
jgi:hypothetical protein